MKHGPRPELAHLVEPMLAGMTTTRHHLLAWVHAHGLAALDELGMLPAAEGFRRIKRYHELGALVTALEAATAAERAA